MSFFSKIISFFQSNSAVQDFEKRVVAFFKTVEDDLVKFADKFFPAAESLVEAAFSDLAEFAAQAVLTEAGKVISGQEKFGNAVASVVQSVEAQGKTVALNTARAAVQLAYLNAQQLVTSR